MPCEGCSVQFTVFRRKRCCADCKRFYCSNCLTLSSSTPAHNVPLCERCAIFAKRPLFRTDLLQLKPKDLIFYLQSKHISTAGCVEKDELVGLVLNHTQQADQVRTSARNSLGGNVDAGAHRHTNNNNSTRNFDSSNSFDALKQTCQNFFSNISEKVDHFSFESSKPTQTNNKPQETHNNRRSTSSSNLSNAHITEQPRVSTREIPTYSSYQHRQTESPTDASQQQQSTYLPTTTSNKSPGSQSHINSPLTVSDNTPNVQVNSSPSSNSQTCSPAVSLESNSPPQFESGGAEISVDILEKDQDSLSLSIPGGRVDCLRSDDKIITEPVSGCDCSDDEIITTFRARTSVSARGESRLLSPQSSSSLENPAPGPSGGSSNVLTSTSTGTKKSSPSLKIESYDESSESSFEELGAIGGTSDDSKTAADSSAQTSEQWLIVDKDVNMSSAGVEQKEPFDDTAKEAVLTVAVVPQSSQVQSQIIRPLPITIRPKKVARRRSDGYLNRRRPASDDDDSPTSPTVYKPLANAEGAQCLREEDEADNERDGNKRESLEQDGNVVLMQGNNLNCKRCGKNRINIKKHVEKMRRHLENSQMSEVDIKDELEEFLVYLEKRTKSIDCSDSETTAASSISGNRETNCQLPLPLPSMSTSSQFYDENDGIHVYASPASYQAAMLDSRFINLEEFETLEDLENLSVKQLKEILMLNRVDYKGCCEKQELFDRVARLWKNLKSAPAVEKLATDELCKICMDAPIECVILECGHMATCTSCGKVLSECPICRQYIVRVVRFFKA